MEQVLSIIRITPFFTRHSSPAMIFCCPPSTAFTAPVFFPSAHTPVSFLSQKRKSLSRSLPHRARMPRRRTVRSRVCRRSTTATSPRLRSRRCGWPAPGCPPRRAPPRSRALTENGGEATADATRRSIRLRIVYTSTFDRGAWSHRGRGISAPTSSNFRAILQPKWQR